MLGHNAWLMVGSHSKGVGCKRTKQTKSTGPNESRLSKGVRCVLSKSPVRTPRSALHLYMHIAPHSRFAVCHLIYFS